MIRSAFVLIAGLAIVPVCAWANVAMITTEGGTALQPKNAVTTVAMTREDVDLYPALSKVEVKAVFALKNIGDKEVQLEVGFPILGDSQLKDFTVAIDGREKPEVKTLPAPKKKEEQEDRAPADPSMPDNADKEYAFSGWMFWTMKFAAGQERRVDVAYWYEPRISDWLVQDKDAKELHDKVAWRDAGYIVRTGAGWAGNIGRGTFRIHWSREVPKANVRSLRPPWVGFGDPGGAWRYDAATETDTLVLNAFKPDNACDIGISYKRVSSVEEVSLLTATLKRGQLGMYQACRNYAFEHLVQLIDPDFFPPYSANRRLLTGEASPFSTKERAARLIEVLEYCVPPLGPEGFEQKSGEEKSVDALGAHPTECLVFRAYETLFTHYLQTGQADKARPLASPYKAVCEALQGYCRKHIETKSGINEKMLAEELWKIKRRLAELEQFLSAGNPK